MGMFMDLAAVLAPANTVQLALAELGDKAACHSIQADRSLVLYDEPTGNFDRVQKLSRALATAAFALHIHDEDLWLYEFYVSGEWTDGFNTMPEYWGELSPADKAALQGNADLLAQHWLGLKANAVKQYFRNWEDMEEVWDGLPGKAYPEDEFAYGDCWQLMDFLRQLGTPYPPDTKVVE